MTPAWEYQSIPIDFEVYKLLTAQLTSPDDTFNDVLRRQLNLPARMLGRGAPASMRPWVVEGVSFPHGTEFQREFKGRLYTARVEDGAMVYDGKGYASPSPAAIKITGNSRNGWTFWYFRRPSDSAWRLMDELRNR